MLMNGRSVCALAAALLAGAACAALAQLPTTDAQDTARKAADYFAPGARMSDAPARTSDSGLKRFRFDLPDGGQATVTVTRTGEFYAWSLQSAPAPSPPEPRLSNEDALAIVQGAARHFLGDSADALTWGDGYSFPGSGLIAIEGQGALVGDPPRRGLTPSCSSDVSATDGRIVHYLQLVPESTKPAPYSLELDDALAIAREAWGAPDARLTGDAHLSQSPDGQLVGWCLTLVGPASAAGADGAPQRAFIIDANTGEIRIGQSPQLARAAAHVPEADPYGNAPSALEEQRSPVGARHGRHSVAAVVLSAALLLAAGVGVVLLRRRR